jgi:glycosyltransferase involved in cell wall biosynthesis
MATEPLVSAVIPVYNGEPFLAEAIDSALAQSRPPHEVIVVDDGSTDASGKVAAAYGGVVRVHRQPNRGIGAARNAGIELTRGGCLAFLDADDRWEADKLERQVAALEADPALEMVFGHIAQFRAGADGATEAVSAPRPGPLAVTMLVRREALLRVGPFPEDVVVSEFLIWLARARRLGLRETMLPEVVAGRRLHDANNGLVNRRGIEEYPRVFKDLLDARRSVKP